MKLSLIILFFVALTLANGYPYTHSYGNGYHGGYKYGARPYSCLDTSPLR